MSNVTPPPPPPIPPSEPPPGYTSYGGATPESSKKALWALISGILGIVVCGPLAIVAIVLGRQAQAEIDGSLGRIGGRGQATAGFVLGIVGLVVWIVLIVYSFS